MSFIVPQFQSPYINLEARQRALDRAFSDPGIPDALHTTKSFWMKVPHPEVSNIQSSHLPESTEYLIIGSGITGASVAQALLESLAKTTPSDKDAQPSSHAKVIMLDARDSCSGATGRNGGHILETGEEYAAMKKKFGKEAAIKIHKLRIAHLEALLESAEELGLTEESQIRKVRFLSVYFHRDGWDDVKKDIESFMADMPEHSKEWGFADGDRLEKEFGIPNAAGAITGIGGAIWPYKFVTGLLAHLRKQFPSNFLLETNTGVSEVRERPEHFEVITPRGIITAKHVIHCTNAHITHLIPNLSGCIFPLIGQMSAQPPGSKFPHRSTHSWIFNYDRGFDYLTQLPVDSTSEGELMMGGGYAQTQDGGVHEIGISTDSNLNMYASMHLRGVLGSIFSPENWGTVTEPAVKAMWTGNMGFSSDGLPWVGRLPASLTGRKISKRGAEWAAAAFSGEGMVHAWLCGKALVEMMFSYVSAGDDQHEDEDEDDIKIPGWFPEQMVVSEERVKTAKLARNAK